MLCIHVVDLLNPGGYAMHSCGGLIEPWDMLYIDVVALFHFISENTTSGWK